ncbi:hypothetical protein LMG7143_04435 [Ralstonia thomasii]|nr:hypothetical protein LMG7143_04435 [Ralstonia sp. LMG 18095]
MLTALTRTSTAISMVLAATMLTTACSKSDQPAVQASPSCANASGSDAAACPRSGPAFKKSDDRKW